MADILVSGGAGFIGSHLVDRLTDQGRRVRVLDILEPQVHGASRGHRNPKAEYLEGSVTDPEVLSRALNDVTAVVHLAAQVGVGQSMYEMVRYVHDNTLGTAVLLQALGDRKTSLQALVVASSMSIYGEGRYFCESCAASDAEIVRTQLALRQQEWEPVCARCGSEVHSGATPENKRLQPDAVYAITKRDQEELCLVFGRVYGIRTVALRFFNVYGPRQSLSNPYTGVAAIFASRLLNRRPPRIYEDGLQSRDFVHVSDIVQGIDLALKSTDVGDIAINLGTGVPTSVLEVARVLAENLELDIQPEIVNSFRQGDVRHCYADISQAKRLLGYVPRVSFRHGMGELTRWIAEKAPAARDLTERSATELMERGLVV